MINLYSSRIRPRRVFPNSSWVNGISDFNKTGGSYLWGRGVNYRDEPSQITLQPAAKKEVGLSIFNDLVKWSEQVVGKTVNIGSTLNLISNSSFEANTTGWDLDADYTRASDDSFDGAFSIKQVSSGASANFNTAAAGGGITVTPNTDYQLTLYAKVAQTSGLPPRLQVNAVSAFSSTNLLGPDKELSDTGGVWVPITVSFNSGQYSAVWIRIYNNAGTVTAHYDKFNLSQINSLASYSLGNLGWLYKRFSSGVWQVIGQSPNSHGNGMAYYGEDDYLYVTSDKTIGRYGPVSSSSPTFVNDFLAAQGGVPTNTNSLTLLASSSQYVKKATPSSDLKITGDIALETYIKPTSLPAVGSSMTLGGLWNENTNNRAYKLDLFGASGYFGNGQDGSLTIGAGTTTDTPIDAQCSGTAGANSLNANNASFVAGQKIIIMQMQGTGYGNKQETTIQGYDSTNHIITTADPLNFSYNSSGSNRAQVYVKKQYTNVTINGTLVAKAWNGTTGGYLGFFFNGTISGAGTISGDACGFRGGVATTSINGTPLVGWQGESELGGGVRSTSNNGSAGGGSSTTTGNGCSAGNAGSSTVGDNGASGGSLQGTPGTGGAITGTSDLSSFTPGAGGGAGGTKGENGVTGSAGGNGGAIIDIAGVTWNGTVTIHSAPGNGSNGAGNTATGGGSGAPGPVRLAGQTVNVGSSLVSSPQGNEGLDMNTNNPSHHSGVGRIYIAYYISQSGTATPTPVTSQDSSLVTTATTQIRLGISNDGTSFEYLAKSLDTIPLGLWGGRLGASWEASTSTVTFYQGGVSIGTVVGTKTAIFSASADFAIGANVGASAYQNFLDAKVDDFRVWASTRTDAQIQNNKDLQLGGSEANLAGYWMFNNNLNDATSHANNLTGVGSPVFSTDVPFAGATTRLDIDQQGVVTGQTYAIPTSLTEAQFHNFVPGQDPQKSIDVNISAKGTGDMTIVIHDAFNNEITRQTITNANLLTGFNEFIYPATWRPVVGATYHFHVFSSVNDGLLVSGAANDATTISYHTYFQFLVNDTEYHTIFPVLNFIGIANERYLATYDAASGYNSRRLKFPAGWRLRCIAKWRGSWAFGFWKGTSVKDFDQGLVALWDGFSITYNDFFDVPEGAVNAMYGENGTLYIIAGYKGDLLEYTGGDRAVKVKRIPKVGKGSYVEVAPGGMTYWQGLLRIAVGYNSDSTTLERGIYTWGKYNEDYPKSLSYDFPISTGNRSTTVQMGAVMPVGGNLLSFWQDNAEIGVDNININGPCVSSGTIEGLIEDFGFYWKEKEALSLRADHLPLLVGQNIDIKYKFNYESTWHNLGITNQQVGDTYTRFVVPADSLGAGRYHGIEVAVDLFSTTGVSPTLLETDHNTDLLIAEQENAA